MATHLPPAALHAAWRELYRPGRPDNAEAMLQHPLLGPCLRGLALYITRHRPGCTPAPAPATRPPLPVAPTAWPPRRALPPLDHKRLAANDLD